MFKVEREDLRWLLPRLGVLLLVILFCYLVLFLGMRMFNKSLGLDNGSGETEEAQPENVDTHDFYVPDENISLPEMEELPEGPEASWEQTPCTLWVSAASEPIIDSLPLAPDVSQKPLEAMFLVRKWAEEAGIDQDELETVYVFTKLDTIYVDLPHERDMDGLKKTIESRFICFTRLFPLIAGNLMGSYPDGISIRGIEGVFRQ